MSASHATGKSKGRTRKGDTTSLKVPVDLIITLTSGTSTLSVPIAIYDLKEIDQRIEHTLSDIMDFLPSKKLRITTINLANGRERTLSRR